MPYKDKEEKRVYDKEYRRIHKEELKKRRKKYLRTRKSKDKSRRGYSDYEEVVMSKRKKQEEELDSLGKIDLSQFAKPKRKKREPICKGCKDKDCDACAYYDWQDLGYHVAMLEEGFIERLSHSIAGAVGNELKYLWGDKKELEKLMNKLALNFIKEIEMKAAAEE
ncbi:hypothetical protein ES703_30206 [subsurface metagenome]